MAIGVHDDEEGGARGAAASVRDLTARGKALRPVRAFLRFASADGNLFAAGMSYRAVFAVFAAVWLGFSATGLWLHAKPALWDAVIELIDRGVPGLIGEHGLISEAALENLSGLGWSSAIAAVGLLWTAISWLNATRLAVRAMFRLGRASANAVVMRLMDLGLALGFGVVLIATALFSVLSTTLLTAFFEALGFSAHSFWRDLAIRVLSLVIAVLLNTVVLAAMFRVLSRVRIPRRMLFPVSALGGVALVVMSSLSGLLLGGAGKNPLVASFAVFLGLLIWFNLVCRVILLSGAWIAVSMEDAGIDPRLLTPEQRELERRRSQAHEDVNRAKADYFLLRRRFDDAAWTGRLRLRRRLARARSRLDAALEAEADLAADPASR